MTEDEKKELRKAKHKEWYEANKERLSKYFKERRDRLKHTPEWKAKQKAYRQKHKNRFREKARDAHLQKRYGLTPDQYQQKWDQQNGLCDVCSRPLVRRGSGGASVDHCHSSGKIRGIVCAPCNTLIGMLEGPRRGMAEAYIERWKNK